MTNWRWYLPQFRYRRIHSEAELGGFRGYTFGLTVLGRYVLHVEFLRDAE